MAELAPVVDIYKQVGVVGPTGGQVTQAQLIALAAAGSLLVGGMYTVQGAPYRAITANTYVSVDGEALTESEETVVIIGASTEERACSIQAISSSSIAVKNNVVTLVTMQAVTSHVGDLMRVASNNFPQIECFATITFIGPESTGTRMTGAVLYGLQLPDTPAGTVTGNASAYVTLPQHNSCTAGYPGLLTKAMGGRVRPIIIGTGGTNTADWNNPYRQALIQAVVNSLGGRVGAIILGPGISGNEINAFGQSADTGVADMETLIQFVRPFARVVYLCQPPAATNENTSNPKVAANTSTFAAGVRLCAAYDQLPKKYPFLRVVPIFAAELQNYGGTTTTDITNAYAPYQTKADDGVHCVWGAAEVWACAIALVMQQDFPYRLTEMGGKPFSVLNSAAADPGGKKISNIFEGFYGTVANTGNIPNSCSASVTAINGMTSTQQLVVNADGGTDWLTKVVSNGNTGATSTTFNQFYTGTATSLAAQLNLPANQGVPIDIWFHCGVYGQNEFGIQFVEAVLEGDYGDGKGQIPIASGFSFMGQFHMPSMTYVDSSKAGMDFGYWGVIRFPRFTIPLGTVLSNVRLRQSAKVKTGVDPGTFYMRLGSGTLISPMN